MHKIILSCIIIDVDILVIKEVNEKYFLYNYLFSSLRIYFIFIFLYIMYSNVSPANL